MERIGRILGGLTFLSLLTVGSLAWGDQGKELYDKLCAGCHSIGGGDSGGPDLKGVTAKRSHEWLESVIIEPDKLTAKKDPIQLELVKKYGYEMPNLGVGHDDALKIITYISGADSAGGAAAASPPASEQITVAVTPELIAKGKALFTGSERFSKGGAPCLSCHPFTYPGIQGGNLSVADLSKSYAKMGDVGMKGALKSLKFPIMKKAYADKPLTDDEITALVALSKDASGKTTANSLAAFPVTGAALFVFLIAGLALYKRRIR